jgi:hypothetical protein
MKKISLLILTDLHIFNTPGYEKVVFGMPEPLDGFYSYLVCNRLSIIGQ